MPTVLDVLQFLVMCAAGALIWSLRQAFAGGRFLSRFEDVEKRLGQIDKRLDQAGEHMSDLTTKIQALPNQLRDEFVTRREATLIAAESERDRANLHRDVDQLWQAVERRRLRSE